MGLLLSTIMGIGFIALTVIYVVLIYPMIVDITKKRSRPAILKHLKRYRARGKKLKNKLLADISKKATKKEVMLKKIDKKLIGEELLIIKGNCFYKDKNKSSDKSIIKKINDGDAELVAISISEKERWEVFLNSIDEVTPTKNHGEKDEYTS